MTIEKRGNSWRAVEMKNGVRYRISFDHKPTNTELHNAFAKLYEQKPSSKRISNLTLAQAAQRYIESKEALLSPSTTRGYYSLVKNIPEDIGKRHIMDLSFAEIQTEISRYAKKHAPKSVANYGGFLTSVLSFFDIHFANDFIYPQKIKRDQYIPTTEDVKAIKAEIKGSKYEVPILLSALGLRRSEICALTLDDLSDDNKLSISKAKVQNKDRQWIIKTTKTTDSTRTIIIPDYLADLIREQGMFEGHPEMLYRTLTKIQRKLGLPHFQLHKMRHFFASYLHDEGLTNKQIQDMGGWKTDIVLKTVYQHAMNMDEAKQSVADKMGKLFE